MGVLSMSPEVYEQLYGAISWSGVEDVAFLFTKPAPPASDLRVTELYRVPPEGFDHQSDVHVSLTDETRAHVIKRAWQIGGTLVEAHSHRHGPAAFSASDLLGFSEWVAHVRWRLRGRPYVALVFAPEGFDALLWDSPGEIVSPLSALRVDGQHPLIPTGHTYRYLSGAKR